MLEKTHILLLLCEGFYIFQLNPVVGYFSVIYFADFLSSSSINCWEMSKKFSNDISAYFYFSILL